jgi:hypothetical protein
MDWRVVLRAWLTVFVVLASAARAPAQLHTGSLHGQVFDSGGRPLAGALVSIGGPIGPLSQVTDSDGRFHFLALPPGGYSVKVQREGVTPVGHPNVTVRSGRSTVIELTASPGGHHALGGAESALLDPRVVSTGANILLEQLEKIPFAPDLASVLQSTPGAYLDLVSVGGATTGDRPTVVFRGASRDANTWSVDGVNLTDMTLLGSAPRYFDFGLIEEIQTVAGGTQIQQMTGGLGVNVITKRGTNLFRGLGRTSFSGSSTFANDVAPAANARLDNAMDFGGEVGGPILKDKLWYFGGIDGFRSDRDGLAADDIVSRDFTRRSIVGKLNLQIPGNALTASGFTSKLDRDGEGASPTRAAGAVWNDDGRTSVLKAEDSVVLGPRVFLTGMAAVADTGFTLDPAGTGPARLDALGIFRDGFQRVTADRISGEARIDLTTYAGAHELKFGAGYRVVDADTTYEWPDGIVTGVTGASQVAVLPPGINTSATTNYGSLYAQDTISRGALTLNLGVRLDRQRGRNKPSEAIANPLSFVVPAVTFAGNEPAWDWTSVVPRIGLTYAFGADRTTLVRASFSQFPDQLGMDRVLLLNPLSPVPGREFIGSEGFGFVDLNGNHLPDPGEPRTASTIVGVATSDPRFLETVNQVADDYRPPMTSEVLFGVDRLIGRGAFSAQVQLRQRTDISDDVPLVQVGATRRPVTFNDFGPGPIVSGIDLDGLPFTLQTFDLDAPFTYANGVSVANGSREQRAMNLTLQYDQRYVRGAYLRGWINFGRSEWRVPGSFFVDRNDLLGADDNDGTLVADPSATPSRSGVFVNGTWAYEFLAMTRVPCGFDVAVRAYGRQGYPAPTFVTVAAADATRLIHVGDFDGSRYRRVFVADFRVERTFPIARFNVDVSADFFNLLNSQTVLQRQTDLIDPLKGDTLEVLSPRVIRFGVRVRF